MVSRILSALIAIGYVSAAYLAEGGKLALTCGVYLLFPLAFIWFSEELGSFTGIVQGHGITSTTPGCFVALAGWLLLFLPVIIGLIRVFSGGG